MLFVFQNRFAYAKFAVRGNRPNLPGAVWSITLQEAIRFYEPLAAPGEASILHRQSNFESSDVILNQETSIFTNFMIFRFATLTMETLLPFKLSAHPMDRTEVVHALPYNTEVS